MVCYYVDLAVQNMELDKLFWIEEEITYDMHFMNFWDKISCCRYMFIYMNG